MRSLKSLAVLSITALGLSVLSTGANALILGTFGFVPNDGITANTANLSSATTVTLDSNSFFVNSIPTTYDGVNPNDFRTGGAFPMSSSDRTSVSLTTTTITNGGSLGLTFTAGGSTFTFTPTSTISLTGSTGAAGNFTNFSVFGNLTDGAGFTPQAALLAGNFNQTAAGSAVNGSFTFSSPPLLPPPNVPEPGTVAMLVGMGVTSGGFLLGRRKRG